MGTITDMYKYFKFFYLLAVLMFFQEILQNETGLELESATKRDSLQHKNIGLKRSDNPIFSNNIYSLNFQTLEQSRVLEDAEENNDQEIFDDPEEEEKKEEEQEEKSNEVNIQKDLIFKKKSSKNLLIQSTDPDMNFEITYNVQYQLFFYEENYFSSLFNGFIIGIPKNTDSVLTVFTNENCGFPLLVASFDSEPKYNNNTNEINIEAEYIGISNINNLKIDEEKVYKDYLSGNRPYKNELYLQLIDFKDIANDFIYLGIYCLFFKSSNTNFNFTTLVGLPPVENEDDEINDSKDNRITVHDIDASINKDNNKFFFEKSFELEPDTAVILNFRNLPGRSAIHFDDPEALILNIGIIYHSDDSLKILNYTRSDYKIFEDIRAENIEVQIYNLFLHLKYEIRLAFESRNPPFEIANINGILFIVIIAIIGLIIFAGVGYIIYKKCFSKKVSNRVVRNENPTENPGLNIDNNNPAERTTLNHYPYNFVINNNDQPFNFNQTFGYDQSVRNTYGQEQFTLQIPTNFTNQQEQPQFQYPLPSNNNNLEVSSHVVKTELPNIHNQEKNLRTYNVDVDRLQYPSFDNPDVFKEYSIFKK